MKEDLLDIFGELAVAVRKRHLRIGPITLADLTSAYRHVMKDEPAGSSLGQLLRMPGLVGYNGVSASDDFEGGQSAADSNHKNFLSYELVEAASARYLAKYLQTQNREIIQNWVGIKTSLTSFGYEVMNHLLATNKTSSSEIKSALYAANNLNTANFSQVDIISFVSQYQEDISFSGAPINIDDIETDYLNLSNPHVSYQKDINK